MSQVVWAELYLKSKQHTIHDPKWTKDINNFDRVHGDLFTAAIHALDAIYVGSQWLMLVCCKCKM